MNTNDWIASQNLHHEAHRRAEKEAKRIAGKVRKAIRYLWEVENKKELIEAAHRSTYDRVYREQLMLELIGLMRRELKASGEHPHHDLAHLEALFGIERGIEQ